MTRRFTYSEVHEFLDNRDIILLSKKYTNNSTKLKLLCRNCNRVWSATFANARAGRGCPSCAGRERLTHDYVKKFLNNLGLELLSSEYVNAKTPLKIKCMCGREVSKTFDVIQRGNIGCKKCAGEIIAASKRYDFSYVKSTINNLGGVLLSNVYKNKDMKIEVLCKKCDIIFYPTFGSIRQGSWCPVCHRAGTVKQKKLFDIIKDIYSDYVIEYNYRAKWLGKQHLDIFVENIGLAIEYDGEQHFRPVCFGGISDKIAEENFKIIIKRDKQKNKKIKNNKDIKYFIRFSYKEKITKGSVLSKLIKYNAISEKTI